MAGPCTGAVAAPAVYGDTHWTRPWMPDQPCGLCKPGLHRSSSCCAHAHSCLTHASTQHPALASHSLQHHLLALDPEP